MALPKRGRRMVVVDGKEYYFLVKETTIPDHRDQKELSVTVQEVAEKPGNILQFRESYWVTISPARIVVSVRKAIAQGWNPSARGGPFLAEFGGNFRNVRAAKKKI